MQSGVLCGRDLGGILIGSTAPAGRRPHGASSRRRRCLGLGGLSVRSVLSRAHPLVNYCELCSLQVQDTWVTCTASTKKEERIRIRN